MDDERDADDAIRALDRMEFGRKGRRLRVEWTKHERGIRRPGGGSRRPSTNLRPSKTLFVINFDPYHTRTRDLERHFDPYGKIVNIRIRRNFAFIQFESQEDATKALDSTNMSTLMDRVISVEYAIRDDDERRNGYSPDRVRDRSPDRRSYDKGRSPSPYRRERGSPDYGHGRSRSPYHRERDSPDYGRRASPDYGRRSSPYRRERAASDYAPGSSPSPHRRERANSENGRDSSQSPNRKERFTPDYGRASPNSKPDMKDSPNYGGDESPAPERYRSRSPPARERSRS